VSTVARTRSPSRAASTNATLARSRSVTASSPFGRMRTLDGFPSSRVRLTKRMSLVENVRIAPPSSSATNASSCLRKRPSASVWLGPSLSSSVTTGNTWTGSALGGAFDGEG
jgi:hypothetical protein